MSKWSVFVTTSDQFSPGSMYVTAVGANPCCPEDDVARVARLFISIGVGTIERRVIEKESKTFQIAKFPSESIFHKC